MSLVDVVVVMVISYWFCGQSMLVTDRKLDPIDQAAYVSQSRGRRFLVGMLWPHVARLNEEFAWYAVSYVSILLVVGIAYELLGLFVASLFLRVVVLAVAWYSPVLTVPFSIMATILWAVVAAPLGARVPPGIARLTRRR